MSSKKEQLIKLLASMSEDEINNVLGSLQEDEVEEKVLEEPEEDTSRHTINRNGTNINRSKRSKDTYDDDADDVPVKNGRRRKSTKKRKENKGRSCRVMPMDIVENRPNIFEDVMSQVQLSSEEKQELANAAKSDEVMKKHSGNRVKLKRPSSLVEVDCCCCGDEYEVPSSLVYNAARWKCNDCSCQAGGY